MTTPASEKGGDERVVLSFTYTNWRGETAVRRVEAASIRVGFGSNEWHPEPQFLLSAFDVDKLRFRDFAVKDIVFAAPPPVAQPGAERLQEALEPFAKASKAAGTGWLDDTPLSLSAVAGLRYRDLRRAEAALSLPLERATGEADGLRTRLQAEDVQWVTNDIAELGVKIGDQFFFLYKGESLVYGALDPDPTVPPVHDDGSQMHWRPVFKREFGECAYPINSKDPTRIGTVTLDDSDEWQPLPAAALAAQPQPSPPVDPAPSIAPADGTGTPAGEGERPAEAVAAEIALRLNDPRDGEAADWVAKNLHAIRRDDGSLHYGLIAVIRAYQGGKAEAAEALVRAQEADTVRAREDERSAIRERIAELRGLLHQQVEAIDIEREDAVYELCLKAVDGVRP